MAGKAAKSQEVSARKTGGRPSGPWKDKLWRDTLRLVALWPVDDTRKGRTKLEASAVALFGAAIAGDVPAAKEIGDRLDGKVPQAHVGGDPDSQPIRVTRIELVDLA
jgi:hypothetical protein